MKHKRLREVAWHLGAQQKLFQMSSIEMSAYLSSRNEMKKAKAKMPENQWRSNEMAKACNISWRSCKYGGGYQLWRNMCNLALKTS
jgi:hypothetical protein